MQLVGDFRNLATLIARSDQPVRARRTRAIKDQLTPAISARLHKQSTFRKPTKFDRRETEIFCKRTKKAYFVAASRVASMSSIGLFAPIGEVDMKSAPGPVRASRTDRRSDQSRP